MNTTRIATLLTVLTLGAGCASSEKPAKSADASTTTEQKMDVPDVTTSDEAAEKYDTFRKYWYRGEAELSRYELTQVRYDEKREGEAILVFVTEDFLKDKQVKHEFGDDANAVPILKLNAHRRFYTGIYPYNIMTSTFTPVKDGPTLKLASSTMEWCGMVYTQFNRRDAGYHVTAYSYFQAEGDQELDLPDAPLEDAVWTRIRLAPDELWQGETKIVPSLHYLRLMHEEVRPHAAEATLSEPGQTNDFDGAVRTYTIEYPNLERTFTVVFEDAFPHRIVGWEESYPSFDGEVRTTEAKLTDSIMLDYWTKNGKKHDAFRRALGLDFDASVR